jgi:hypothetical protein
VHPGHVHLKEPFLEGQGALFLITVPQHDFAFNMPGPKTATASSKEDVMTMLKNEAYSVPLSNPIIGLVKSIFGPRGHVLKFTQSGDLGVSGRSRLEGVLTNRQLVEQLFNFTRTHQRFQKIRSVLLFSYYSQEALDILIEAANDDPLSLPGNFSESVVASLDVLKEAASVPQRILPHGDYKAMIGVRMMKAIFSSNTSSEDSFWDFYLDEGTFLCTLRIPNGSCLFISDFALGMLRVSTRV